MKNIDRKLLTTLILSAFPACFDEPLGTVNFLSPALGSSSGPDVLVKLKLSNVDLQPSGSHLFLLIDEPCLAPGQKMSTSASRLDLETTTEVSLTLLPGDHALCAQVADENAEATEAMATVQFVVRLDPSADAEILSPYDGAALASSFTVQLAASGVTLSPVGAPVLGQGHLYLVVDGVCPLPTPTVRLESFVLDLIQGQTTAELTLEMGYHTLCAGLATNDDQVLPVASKSVRVYVAY